MAKKHKQPKFFHEVLSKGPHRIVEVTSSSNGIIQTKGAWAASHEIAVYGSYRANSGIAGSLPLGIFKVSRTIHETLMD